MENIKFSREEKNAVFALFDKCDVALLKVSLLEDGTKHIDKVYIDGKEYDMPSSDLTHQLYLCAGAVDLIREKGNILKLSKDEQNFVIRNHPTWMLLRGDLKFYDFDDSELYGVARAGLKKPYSLWMQDYVDSLGEKRFYPRKNMNSFMVTYEEFGALLQMNKENVRFPITKGIATVFPKNANPLYRGLFEAARVKFENNPNLKVELNKYGYPEVSYLQNGQWFKIDVSTKEGLNKLFEFSPSPLGKISDEEKKNNQKVKKRPTKGKKRK